MDYANIASGLRNIAGVITANPTEARPFASNGVVARRAAQPGSPSGLRLLVVYKGLLTLAEEDIPRGEVAADYTVRRLRELAADMDAMQAHKEARHG